MNVRLPINIPQINGYKHHALPLAIITQAEQGIHWMTNNFLQLYTRYGITEDPHWLEFYLPHNILDLPHNPFVHVQKVRMDLLKDIDLAVLFRNAVEEGTYIYAWYDPKYFKSNDTGHAFNNLLIYGFDDSRKVFHVLDYDYNGSRKLSQMEIGFNEMNQSIHNLAFPEDWSTHIYFISATKRVEFTFDYVLASQLLEDYINAGKTVNRFRMNVDPAITNDAVFGIQVYDVLLVYLESLLVNDKNYSVLPFHILFEHKQCIQLLVRFLGKTYQVNEEPSIENVNTAMAFRNMMIKYSFSSDKEIIRKIMTKIPDLIAKEVNHIQSILNAIR